MAFSPALVSGAPTGAVSPPPAATRESLDCPLKTTTPSRFQVPPRVLDTSASAWDTPVAMSIFDRRSSVKKPTKRESGDQNGSRAPSVPSSRRGSRLASSRTQRWLVPDADSAVRASQRPSGEMTACSRRVPGGAATGKSIGLVPGATVGRNDSTANVTAAAARAVAAISRAVRGSTLIATSRSSFVSVARYTSPIPPAPRGATI